MSACLLGTFLAGCAGGGSSATHTAGAIPPIGPGGAAPAGVRHASSVPSCSGTGTGAFVGGGFENVADGAYSGVLEGNSNEVCDEESAVGGGYYNFISSGANTSYYAFIGSGYDNSISGNGYQSVIGGGNVNSLTAPNSVIGGGNQNTLSASDSVIAGGSTNAESGNGTYAAIGGGSGNSVTGEYGAIAGGINNTVSSPKGVIGGGNGNAVSGQAAVVSGGGFNTAGGYLATVPGGQKNSANGSASFAAGYDSNAATDGSFVWSDYTSGATQLSSTRTNQFLARATGGFTFWTNAANTVGATLPSGSGAWSSASDRAMKVDLARIDDADVLDKVARLPITRWSYLSERGVRHVGPMAQDFYAAFGVGEDDKHITAIDEDGVALAAIKALHAENAQLRADQRALRKRFATESAAQTAQLARLEVELTALRTLVARPAR
jgi:hypothetical protein